MCLMSVTCETSHLEMSWLKLRSKPRRWLQSSMKLMSVTLLMSHQFMTQSSPAKLVFWHSLTALVTSVLVSKPVRLQVPAALASAMAFSAASFSAL